MAEEIKNDTTPEVDAEVTETTEAPEPVESEETEAPEVEESTTEETTEEPTQPDYKAIADQERQRREKAEKAAADANFKLREAKRAGEVDTAAETDDDKPLTMKEAKALFEQQQQEATKSSQEEQVRKIIAENTTSEDEAEAAYLMYQNRVVPTGDPQADAMFAIGGLNVNRTKAIAEEVKRSVTNKQNAATHATSHQPDIATKDEPKLNPNDAQAIKDAGMKWDGKKRVYVKPVGKRTMFFDPSKRDGEKSWIA